MPKDRTEWNPIAVLWFTDVSAQNGLRPRAIFTNPTMRLEPLRSRLRRAIYRSLRRELEITRDSDELAGLRPTECNAPENEPMGLSLSPEIDVVSARVGKLLILKNDLGVSECIRTTGVWANEDIELFSRLIKPGMFVADVGAYIGHHTVHFARLVGASGLVVAFEPQRVPFRVLSANLLLNSCGNVDAYNCALGAAPEQVELWPHKTKANFGAVPVVRMKSGAVPTVFYKGETTYGTGGETADLSTVDLKLSRYRKLGRTLDFIKIDVQAFELFVLQGAKEILTVDRPVVFFEVSPYWMDILMGYDYLEIYRLFESVGYRVVDPHGDHNEPTRRRWSGDQDEEWDCLAIPRGG